MRIFCNLIAAKLLILAYFLLILSKVYSEQKQIEAVITNIDIGNLVEAKMSEIPSQDLLTNSDINVIFQGNVIGKLVYDSLLGDRLQGLFKPQKEMNLKENMTVTLSFERNITAQTPLLLTIQSINGNTVQLSGGQTQGVNQEDYFEIYSEGRRVGEAKIIKLDDNNATAQILNTYGPISIGNTLLREQAPQALPKGFKLRKGGNSKTSSTAARSISGRIFLNNSDGTSTPLNNYQVILTASTKHYQRKSKTNSTGEFNFPSSELNDSDIYWLICTAKVYKTTGPLHATLKSDYDRNDPSFTAPPPSFISLETGTYISESRYKAYILLPRNYIPVMVSWHVRVNGLPSKGVNLDLTDENIDSQYNSSNTSP